MSETAYEFNPARHAAPFTRTGCACICSGAAMSLDHQPVAPRNQDVKTDASSQGISAATTIGLLYPGEMGASLARLLKPRGARLVTTLQDRSERTALRCREAGVNVLGSMREVARVADVVISVVPPACAAEVAENYCQWAHLSPPAALYVDANSIGPELAKSLAARLTERGRDFVDASIHGLSSNLAGGAMLFLSGLRAGEAARLFEGATRVRILSPEPGTASLMKMLLGGVSKGLCALLLELATLARRRDVLPEMMEACGDFYPEIAALMERVLPTIPRHVVRRSGEMDELETTTLAAGLEPCVIGSIRRFYEHLARAPLCDGPSPAGWTATSLIEHLAAIEFLAVPRADARESTGTGAMARGLRSVEVCLGIASSLAGTT